MIVDHCDRGFEQPRDWPQNFSKSVVKEDGASSATVFGPTSASRRRASPLVKPVGLLAAATVSGGNAWLIVSAPRPCGASAGITIP